jgi:hypothetical protein
VSSDAIYAVDQKWGSGLLGDKAHSMLFDNSKIKSLVPDFNSRTPFSVGAREIIAWHDADPTRKRVDAALDFTMDKLIDAYRPRPL